MQVERGSTRASEGGSLRHAPLHLLGLRQRLRAPRFEGQSSEDRIVDWIFQGTLPLVEIRLKYLEDNKDRVKRLFGLNGDLDQALSEAKEIDEIEEKLIAALKINKNFVQFNGLKLQPDRV